MDAGQAITIILAVLAVAVAGAMGAVLVHRRSQEPEASAGATDGKKSVDESYAIGLPIGIAIGVAIGTATDNMGMGIAIGVAIGIALGAAQGKIC
jgi:hypothetical protein